MRDPSIDSNVQRPPAEAFADLSIRGTRCQEQTTMDGKVIAARHDGCPGWWAGLEGESGFACGCSCHDDRGWPGWDTFLEKQSSDA